MKDVYKGNDLSNNDYHAEQEHLSSSNLKMLLKNPEKFHKEKILNQKEPQKDIPAFAEGSLVHGMILEPHLLDEEFSLFDGFRKMGKVWDAFKAAEKSGKKRTILSKPQWKRCEGLVKGFEKHSTAVEMVNSCDKEFSVFGELDGVKCKARADLINIEEGFIADIKTTSYDTDVDSFKFTMQDFGYGLSAALYCQMFEQQYEKPFDFYFIVLGKKDRSCEIYKISKETRLKGDREVYKALKLFKQCKETGIWKSRKVDILAEKSYTGYEIQEV